ncbi:hypothetical protein NPIL_568491 [Nephila pilipes]|uniref:Uncharacterized protein n=1 Tax=Nephila pilipes TaxID=299642 RepID=A0A8X6MQN0_NEPPI|nr:hypothetical protein NPIL_568491 [Nephila pilipes]
MWDDRNVPSSASCAGIDRLNIWSQVMYYYISRGKSESVSIGETVKQKSDLLMFLDNIPSSESATIANVESSLRNRTLDENKALSLCSAFASSGTELIERL